MDVEKMIDNWLLDSGVKQSDVPLMGVRYDAASILNFALSHMRCERCNAWEFLVDDQYGNKVGKCHEDKALANGYVDRTLGSTFGCVHFEGREE